MSSYNILPASLFAKEANYGIYRLLHLLRSLRANDRERRNFQSKRDGMFHDQGKGPTWNNSQTSPLRPDPSSIIELTPAAFRAMVGASGLEKVQVKVPKRVTYQGQGMERAIS